MFRRDHSRWLLPGALLLSLACSGGGSSSDGGASLPNATPTSTPGSALTLAYRFLPLPIDTAVTPIPAVVGNASAGAKVSFALTAGALPQGLTLNADGSIQGTPAVAGTFKPEITATQGTQTAVASPILIVIPAANGLNSDRPVLQYDQHGACGQPWGAAGFAWPQQLFWQDVDMMSTSHVGEMRASAQGMDSVGLAPVLGCVAWGYEYTSATGGDPNNLGATPDNSAIGGWKEWGAWMTNHPQYQSTDWHGKTEAGYFTPLMPMDPADWPATWTAPAGWVAPAGWSGGKPTQTTSYAEWLGTRLAQLCYAVDCRGMMCADYVVGLEWGDAVDYNPRVMDDFATWAGVTIPGTSIEERSDYIQVNLKALWWDYKCTRFRDFYGSLGKNLLANGKTPMVGGQISGYPMWTRGSGNDFRIYTQGNEGLLGQYWFFNVELQADSLRPPTDYWLSALAMASTAAREPDMRLGGQMDATGGQGEFDRSVTNAGYDAAWGLKYITHQWLSVGWSHIAGRDGVVRRAPMSFMRSYWDAGKTPEAELMLIQGHIPRHPFGPAFYYSASIERAFEEDHWNSKTSNGEWFLFPKMSREVFPKSAASPRRGHARGLCMGYVVSDVGLDHMAKADRPSGWIIYDDDRLPAAERAKLEAIAPIYNIDAGGADADGSKAAALLALGPVHIAQDSDQCLNALAFVDQNDSVILMISNTNDTPGTGDVVFTNVGDGSFAATGLLNANDTSFAVQGGTGRFAISVPARGTLVFEIPKLKWLNH